MFEIIIWFHYLFALSLKNPVRGVVNYKIIIIIVIVIMGKCPLVLFAKPLNKGFIIPLFSFLVFWVLVFEIHNVHPASPKNCIECMRCVQITKITQRYHLNVLYLNYTSYKNG